MGILQSVGRMLLGQQPPRSLSAERRSQKIVQAAYDAAQPREGDVEHWRLVDSLSAAAALSPGVRRVVRERARYEVANNAYATGMLLTLSQDLVGRGPRPQIIARERSADAQRLERLWSSWAAQVDLGAKLRTMRTAKATDGEAFALITNNPGLDHPIQLDVQLVECDRVTTPDLRPLTPSFVDGIEFDGFGNPSTYHVLRYHPGTLSFSGSPLDYDRVPARNVVHLFRCSRPEQVRGVSEIVSALLLYGDLRRYTRAVIAAAETAANVAGVIRTTSHDVQTDDNVEPMDAVDVPARSLLTLPMGWDLNQIRAEQPTQQYGDFKREVIGEMARCLNVPRIVALASSEESNFSSARRDDLIYHRSLSVERAELEVKLLARLWRQWIREAAGLGLAPREYSAEAPPVTWHWDGYGAIDPVKQAQAQEIRLRIGVTTLAAEAATEGLDWEDLVEQRGVEAQRLRALGLPVPGEAAAVPPAQEATDDDDDPADAGRDPSRGEARPDQPAAR